ncbi:family 20 glycosylhydrolase [Aestuariibaculum suncheonense]|uniref:beta-N-acetylhexosaminidase n=2 Tax=Aestuariibaculum suncheonense TaxID=1028745 RepID=A0A8J6QI77_9FLAO|nr:family 20 glycosylhydrolase [Aestuariibaculum suncheonense]
MLASCQSKPVKFTEADIQIIPKPLALQVNQGGFQFNSNTQFVVEDESQKAALEDLINKFKTAAGFTSEIVNETPSKNYVQFVTDANLKQEAYNLEVNSNGITIKSNGTAGFVYGVETLRQLLPTSIESNTIANNEEWVIPNVSIKDEPRFKYRGLMLDLSRHFFDSEYIKQTIDRLAMHKMNVLHLHLVDDQGWRIEIKQYPKLTEIGAWRVDQEDKFWHNRDKNPHGVKGTYGGFLTQEELKDIVAYAASKNIEVIPEIEMPAHVSSAIASYPELACFNQEIGVPSGGLWPITDIYCAGKDSTFEFLENVLDEVMTIFPSKYIHIGGDEATKTNWKICPHCKKRVKEEGLKDVDELQSYFVKRMEKYINSKGKQLIGWDEIIEGGLAPEATVMSWRGVKPGIEAAKQGHDVIMTPTSHCYFDYYQGPQEYEPTAFTAYTPLSKVYQFDPIADEMTPEDAKHVLGGQANLWAEYLPTNDQSEYMIFPRLAAMSEALWSPKDSRNWEDFSRRLEMMFERYEDLDINYAKSAYILRPAYSFDSINKAVNLSLKNEFPNPDIRYVLGDVDLNQHAQKYTGTFQVKETTILKASLFKDEKPVGMTYVDTIKFHKALGKLVTYNTEYSSAYKGTGAATLDNALRGSQNFHDGQWQGWLTDMEVVIDLENQTDISNVAVGTLESQKAGIYFPVAVEVSVSNDGKTFEKIGEVTRPYAQASKVTKKDFVVEFSEQSARFVKVKAIALEKNPRGGGVWLFVDEILVN